MRVPSIYRNLNSFSSLITGTAIFTETYRNTELKATTE